MRRFRIHSRLFIAFTLIVTLVIGSLSTLYYRHMSSVIWERTLESSNQMLFRHIHSLDQNISDMDRLAKRVIYNTSFRTYFENPFPLTGEDFDTVSKRNNYVNILAAFNGPWFIAKQINVFNMQGDFIRYGFISEMVTDIKQQYAKAHWIEDTLAKKGGRQLNPPHLSEWTPHPDFIFSLTRELPVPPGRSRTIVEVQQPYSLLEKVLENITPDSDIKMYIADDEGRIFYPASRSGKHPNLFSMDWTAEPRNSFHWVEMTNPTSGEKEILSYMRSPLSELTVAAVQPKATLMQPIYRFRSQTILTAGIIELISLALAYLVASTITSPIRLLREYTKKVDLDNIHLSMPENERKFSGELLDLFRAFMKMRKRLRASVLQLLDAQKRENLAHLQAMQAQLNPHFLFNTLSAMESLADELEADKVGHMCRKLADYMRYINLSSHEPVPLHQEIRHTIAYLELMKIRYENRFHYDLEFDQKLESIYVPKLILQPIIENSFIHGFQSVYPPWKLIVAIHANPSVTCWSIKIADNGAGFSQESLSHISELMARLNAGKIDPLDRISMRGIGGMGLENTLTRLRLFWKERVQFNISNLPEGMEMVITITNEGGIS